MSVFIWTLEEMDEDREEWFIGHTPEDRFTTFWYAGMGREGERRWVKSRRDAMSFPTKDEALTTLVETGKKDTGFVNGGPVNTDD